MSKIIIDAKNQVTGRLASKTVKEVLKGNEVDIVNAEHAVILGNPDHIIKTYKEKIVRGDPYHGPFYPKSPDRMLKRTIRGMLPYKKPRGREALKRVKVFISVPEDIANEKFTRFKEAENKGKQKYMSLGELSKKLGAKK